MSEASQVPIADLISYLRTELIRAGEAGKDMPVRFETMEIELELQVGVSKSLEGNAGIELYVFSLGADGGYEKEQIQTIRLKMKPIDGTTGGVLHTGGHQERD